MNHKFRFVYPLVAALIACALLVAFKPSSGKSKEDLGIDFEQPKHPVTKQMELETSVMSNRVAPFFETEDSVGKKIVLGSPNAPHPQFILFIKDGCPCSIDAQPIFNSLSRKFAGKVDFVGVMDQIPSKVNDYSTQFLAAFPIVPDKKLAIVHKYEALASVYSVLVARNGHIVKMWPGYSSDMIKEMNALISKAADVKETKFDPQYSPQKKTSGCAFE